MSRTYVSELRRNKDTHKVKIEYRNNTVVEKVVVKKPVDLNNIKGSVLRDLGDVGDSDGTLLGGITTNVEDGSILVFNADTRIFETTTTLGRSDRPNQVQKIDGGEY